MAATISGKSDSRCRICGKLLTDPVSVQRGIGPECAGKHKRAEHGEKTGNLFANRAEYSWGVDGNILWIRDEQGMNRGAGRSVTNDIDFVLGDIYRQIGADLFKKLIMYRDSEQWWDGVQLRTTDCYIGITSGGQRSERIDIDEFFSIHEQDYTQAKVKLLGMVNQGKIKPLTPTSFFA